MGGSGTNDGVATGARFSEPAGVATDAAGNVYVADTWNQLIRKVIVGAPGQSGFLPGPLPGVIGPPSGLAISGTSLYITTSEGVAVVTNVP
jgi:hypothetical protein